ncbi:TonB-dependent receptor plug domain-containing protein [Roseivirga sp.]|uniref:TonB-dependent receptor plug domain-containing protein n=1 Tax=Roseivirga sp. TaxID=1964215 RepID=UPI003B8AA449
MKKFLLTLLVMSVGFQGALLAQTKTVTGTVTGGDDGLGIPRVSVTIKGTTRGNATNLDGTYSVEVASNETLVFSFVGYVSKEVLVGNQTTIDVVLEPDYAELEEVVVVGYGSQERKEITSAVASLKPEDFNNGNIANPTQLLQGKVAGLSITRPGGDPNGAFNIRLRGISTFGANSSPLIVLDGVPGADLGNVDPNDIASIDVLKDGSAAAIYGARGSSGVILITTTKGSGEDGVTNISLNTFATVDTKALDKISVLSPSEFVAAGGTDFGSETDWVDLITQNAFSYATNLSVSGSFGGTSYRASVNYRNNEGIVKGFKNERLNTRLNVTHNAINDRLRLTANVNITNGSYGARNNGLFDFALTYNPTAPVFDDGTLSSNSVGGFFQTLASSDYFNPEALRQQQNFSGTTKTSLLSFRGEFDILDNLTAAIQYNQDRSNGLNSQVWSKTDFAQGLGQNGQAGRTVDDRFTEIITGTLNWDTEISSDLSATVLVGFEKQTQNFEGFGLQSRQFLFDSFGANNLAAGAIITGPNTNYYSYKSQNILNSAFFRANANYKGTYFVSASVRADSYSGFGENNKTGYFPTVSAGAELTEIADLGPISQLKFRASYGITGALPGASDYALPVIRNGGRIDLDGDANTTDDIRIAPRQTQNANPELKWETKKEFNIGFDFSILDGKITGTTDYYTRNIEDLIFNIVVPIGAPSAFDIGNFNTVNNTWVNLADLRSAGFEFAASYNGLKIGDVAWSPSINFTIYDKTTIESLTLTNGLGFENIRGGNLGSPGQNNTQIIFNEVGKTLGNFVGPRFIGIDENGQYVLEDANGVRGSSAADFNIEDLPIIGNALPDAEFGINNAFSYGDWNLSFFLRGTLGHELYNSFRGFYENQDASTSAWNSIVTDKTPTVSASPTFSDLFIEDASFIRLDNLQLGYRLPSNSDWIENINLYFAAQNLFTITNYQGLDPEARTSDGGNQLVPGLERRNTFIPTRSFTLGVKFNIK